MDRLTSAPINLIAFTVAGAKALHQSIGPYIKDIVEKLNFNVHGCIVPFPGGRALSISPEIVTLRNVFFLLLTGVVLIAAFVVLVSSVLDVIGHLCCRCCGASRAPHTTVPRDVEGGEVARDAGLSGMTTVERRSLLEMILVAKV